MTPELGKPSEADPLTEEGRRTARRAFLAGSLTVPVITTLASRPAWAGCGMWSVMDSANHGSHAQEYQCSGMPVDYWKMHPEMVDQYVAYVGPANPVDYLNVISTPTDYSYPSDYELKTAQETAENKEHRDAIKQYRGWLSSYGSSRPEPPYGGKFNRYFGSFADENLTIMQALWRPDLQLICQSTCAWLNANEYPGSFGYSVDQVVNYFQTKGMEDPALLIAAFTAMNSASLTV